VPLVVFEHGAGARRDVHVRHEHRRHAALRAGDFTRQDDDLARVVAINLRLGQFAFAIQTTPPSFVSQQRLCGGAADRVATSGVRLCKGSGFRS
jgi:hypothetical protein